MALASPGGFDGDPIDHQRPATAPGAGRPPYHKKAQRKHAQQRTSYSGDDDDGGGRVVLGAKHNLDTVNGPSLDILFRNYCQDESNATAVVKMASAVSTEGKGCREWMERGTISERKDDGGIRKESRDTEERKTKLQGTRSSTIANANERETQTGDDVGGNQGPSGRLQTSKVRYTTGGTPSGEACRRCNAVLPMAFPGEAHDMTFGAVAKAVVLASGSSRFMVSR